MDRHIYTDEQVIEAVKASETVVGVLRYLGIRQAGTAHRLMKRRVEALGVDTSHFKGRSYHRGKTYPNRRRPAADILTLKPEGRTNREHAHLLRRALAEVGRPYVCTDCGLGPEWNGRPLTLDVDHINGNWLDDRAENLRFLCPNCHAQQETSRPRRISSRPAPGTGPGQPRGERVSSAKLTADDVRAIRATDTATSDELAARFNVSRNTINAVRSRTTWRHVA